MSERRRTTFWHNCVMHPFCGVVWTVTPRSRLGRWADAVHSRAHDRMDPDLKERFWSELLRLLSHG